MMEKGIDDKDEMGRRERVKGALCRGPGGEEMAWGHYISGIHLDQGGNPVKW